MPYKLLLADSDKITHKLIESYLVEYHELTLYQTYAIHETIELARKIKPDIIIFDINLSLVETNSFVENIRNDLKKRIPFIITYRDINLERINEILKDNLIDILKKPFDKLDFLFRLKSSISFLKLLQEINLQREQIISHEDELNKLSLIIKKSANSVIILNTNGDIEWVNEGFTRVYGYALEQVYELYGKNIRDFASNSQMSWEKFQHVLDTQQSISYVNKFISSSGQVKWLQTTLTPIFEGNKIDKIVAIETNISKEKEAEIKLKRQKEELERLAKELKEKHETLIKQRNFLQDERKKIDLMLENIMPKHVVKSLIHHGYAKPRSYRKATVMFADFKSFTKACKNLTPEQIVNYLNFFFTKFDDIVVDHFIEKIKTIGDAYMCVGGVPVRNKSHAFDVVLAALKFQYFLSNLDLFDKEKKYPRWELRIGVHTGPLIAGIVGKIKFAYDVWGDTVNTAQRIQSACEPGKINISATTYEIIKEHFICEPRGLIEVKHGGKVEMYYVKGLKPEYAFDKAGFLPNKQFNKFYSSL